MAQLNDLIVNGSARFLNTVYLGASQVSGYVHGKYATGNNAYEIQNPAGNMNILMFRDVAASQPTVTLSSGYSTTTGSSITVSHTTGAPSVRIGSAYADGNGEIELTKAGAPRADLKADNTNAGYLKLYNTSGANTITATGADGTLVTAGAIKAGNPANTSTFPAVGYKVHDTRGVAQTPGSITNYGANFFFSNNTMPDSKWWAGLHVHGWSSGYNAWEIVGAAHNDDARTRPLYVRTSNQSSAWGSWRKIYDTSNPPTTSEVGALATTGGTMTGSITCTTSGANLKYGNTTIYGAGSNGGLNSMIVGDDVYLGDCNVSGMLGMKSTGTNTGFRFYNSSGTTIGGIQSTSGTLQWVNSSGTANNISYFTASPDTGNVVVTNDNIGGVVALDLCLKYITPFYKPTSSSSNTCTMTFSGLSANESISIILFGRYGCWCIRAQTDSSKFSSLAYSKLESTSNTLSITGTASSYVMTITGVGNWSALTGLFFHAGFPDAKIALS